MQVLPNHPSSEKQFTSLKENKEGKSCMEHMMKNVTNTNKTAIISRVVV